MLVPQRSVLRAELLIVCTLYVLMCLCDIGESVEGVSAVVDECQMLGKTEQKWYAMMSTQIAFFSPFHPFFDGIF